MSSASGRGGLQAMGCERCGASVEFLNERLLACSYCGQVYNLEAPRLGELLLAADFRDPQVPGWVLYERESLRVGEGGRPWLFGDFRKNERARWMIESFGSFDNLDASVTITFLEVEDVNRHCRLGLALRWTEEGRYGAGIAADGHYYVGAYDNRAEAGKRWSMFVNDASHPALRAGVGVANRLRVVARDDRLRVYVNNALVSSVRDSKYAHGTVGVVLENSGSDVKFALSELELREAVADA